VIKQERDGPNTGLQLVDTAVKYTNKMQIEKRHLEAENADLKQQLARIKQSIHEGETERERFFEGAAWSSKQCVQACDSGLAKFELLKQQYEGRIKECGSDHFMRLRAADWLLDSSQRLVKEVRDDN